jgi:alpha-L-rhamnosidase
MVEFMPKIGAAVRFVFLSALFFLPSLSWAQIAPELLTKPWTARWITCPDAPQRDTAIFHFRQVLELNTVPQHFIVHVSADNQFLLYVNQQRAGSGPARADLAHWRFETYDLAPLLHSGRNVLAATVWSFGTQAAIGQMSDRAGFLLQGNTAAERTADTNESWEAEPETAIAPLSAPADFPEHFYYAAELPERLDGASFDWLWNADPRDNPSQRWKKAAIISRAGPRGVRFQDTNWELVPDPLPPMAMELVPAGKVVRASGVEIPAGFPEKAFTVPAHTKASVLLDAAHLTTAYPELTVSGGAGATIRLTYAEALYDKEGVKGNRTEIAGKHIAGVHDEFLPDGSRRIFTPLPWRTWRFLQLDISTADQRLDLEQLRTWFTAYPFTQRGHFAADDASLASIWDIGWRTARLDAHDTYMDTPYWERLQYVGDTRIQALISYTVAGDDRLARQAIQAFDDSRIPDGITQSRYPSSLPQIIPTFSLLWIGMVHDFWLYRDDPAFVQAQVPGTRTVLDWYLQHQRADGLLEKLPWWVFADWAEDFENGEPPQDASGGSAVITLQFIEALRYAAQLENAYGDAHRAQTYRAAMMRAAEGLRKLCWNQKFGLFADTPAQKHFSQHANILAVWLDLVPAAQQRAVLTRVLSASDAGFKGDGPVPPLSKATYYFRFYLARAVQHAGMGDDYIRLLQPWRDMLALGLSTWAEKPEPTRSDSHAWSAHPNYDLLTIVAGIRPQTPGFSTVTIEPNLGSLNHVTAAMAHQQGEIKTEYTRTSNGVEAQISLPPSLSGSLAWQGKRYPLHEGTQHLTLPVPPKAH